MSTFFKSTTLMSDTQFGEKAEETIFSSFVTKEGSIHKTWKKRFMELVRNKATGNIHIRYYKDPKTKKQKGEIVLRFPNCCQCCLYKRESERTYFKILIKEPSQLQRSSSVGDAIQIVKKTSFR